MLFSLHRITRLAFMEGSSLQCDPFRSILPRQVASISSSTLEAAHDGRSATLICCALAIALFISRMLTRHHSIPGSTTMFCTQVSPS